MSKPIRILIVEDLASDFELAQIEICKSVEDCVFEQVDTRPSFLKALETFQPDVILSDYSLPRFDGMTALKLAKVQAPLTPFIIWTGSMSEDIAVECMKAGANNYILKENLKRLGPAIKHSIEERHILVERQRANEALQESEARYHGIFESAQDAIFLESLEGNILDVNQRACQIYGYTREEFLTKNISDLVPSQEYIIWFNKEYSASGKPIETINVRSNGEHFPVELSGGVYEFGERKLFLIVLRDITERKQAEKSYQEIFENSQEGIFRSTPEGRYIKVNPAMARIYGYDSPEDMIQSITSISSQIYVDPKDRDEFILTLHANDRIERFEMRNLSKGGSILWTSTSARAVRDTDGKILYYEGFLQDITERKLAEIEIQRRNDDLRLINAINEGAVHDVRLEGIVNLLAGEFKRIFSSTGSTLYLLAADGKSLNMQQYLLPPEIQRQVERLIGSTIPLIQIPIQEGGFLNRVLNSQHGFVTSDREEIQQWMMEFLETPFLPKAAKGVIRKLIPQIFDVLNIRTVIAIPLLLNGKAIGILDVSSPALFTENDLHRIENISGQLTAALQRQKANQQLRRSEEFLQSVQNALSASIAILDENGVIVQVNSAWRKFGEQNDLRHPEYCIGLNYLDICDMATGPNSEEAYLVARAIREVISEQRREVQVEYPCHSPEEKRWFTLRITKFDDGDHIWVVLAHENITERKQAENAFKETSEQFHTLFEASPEGIILIEPQGDWRILDCNEAACAMNGYTRDELVGQSIDLLLLTSGDPVGRLEYLASVREAGILRYDDYHRRKDGTIFPITVSTSLITLGGREVILGIDHDITERKRAEDALRESEAIYRQAIEVAGAVPYYESYYDNGLAIKYDFIGDGIRQITGYGPEEFNAKLWDSLVEEVVLVEGLEGYSLEEGIQRVRSGENPIWKCEHRIRDREGKTHWVFEAAIEIRDEHGISHGSIGTYQDITARKAAEEEVRKATEKYRNIFENAMEAIHQTTPDGRYLTANPATARILGYESAEALMASVTDLDHHFYVDAGRREEFKALMEENGFVSGFESEVYRGDGSIIWISENVRSIYDLSGRLMYYEGTTQEITERKQAERAEHEQRAIAEALRDTAETLNSTLDYGEVLDHILTAAGRVVPHDAASILLIDSGIARAARERGYGERGFRAEVMEMELSLTDTANLRQMNETGQPVVISETSTYPGWKVAPHTAWLHSNVGAPISIHGERVGFILLDSETPGFFTAVHAERLKAFANQAAIAIQNSRLLKQAQEEILERKRAEEELRQSESRYRTVVENQTEFIVRWTPNGGRTFVNDAYCHYFGITREQALTTNFIPLVYKEDQPAIEKKISRLLSGSIQMETDIHRVIKPDGSIGWQEWTDQAIHTENGQLVEFQSVGRDITERIKAEQELRASEERFRQLADNIQEVFWMTDAISGEEIYISPASEKVWGRSIDSMLHDQDAFIESVLPEDRSHVLRKIEEQRNGLKTDMEYRILRSDGSVRWVWDRAFPIFDETGKVIRLAGIAADITERKQVQDELRESEIRYRGLFENLVIGFALHEIVTDEAGKPVDYVFLEINPMFEKLTGIHAQQAIGRRVSEVLPGIGNERFIQIYGNVALTGEPVHFEEFSENLNKYYEINAYSPKHGQFAVTFIDITERKRTEAEAQRHLAELEALYENGLAVGRLLNPHEIGERVIATFARHLSWHHVTIRLTQADSDNLELIAFSLPGLTEEEKFSVEQHFQAMISKVGQGLSGWVAQTGEPFCTGNVHAQPQYVNTQAGIQSGLYMPLKIGDRVIGVISVESEEPDAFTSQDERLLATLASQAAIALENARLYQTNQLERERFSELFENTPVATWLEDFSAVIAWMNSLRNQGITNLKEYLEKNPEAYKVGISLIDILNVNHSAVVMNGARDKNELLQKVHGLLMDETPSQVMINEMELIWKGYTSFGFEMSSQKLDGSIITGIQRIYIPITNNEPDYRRVIVTNTDITDRVGFEQRLRSSEVHYRELADSITDVFFELDQNLHLSHWNKASEVLTGFSAEHAIGKSMFEVFSESSSLERIEQVFRVVREKHQPKTFEATIPLQSQSRTFEINAYPSTRGVAVVAKDVTERKLSESLMQKRFELMEYSAEHRLEELMQKALDEISEWTHSSIGFFQFIMEDQITPSLQVWSTDTFQHFHSSEAEEMHKPADQAGVWAEAIRLRRAVIHNDFASMPGKKGLPESHATLLREMVVPIIRNERIVAVIGIGNKPQEYTRNDLEIMERFADYAWDVIERKQMVTELAEERNQLAKRVEERTSDLSRANSNLARALRVKDEFLASMSHELRTPLNAILGLSESLSEQIAGPLNEKQQKYLTTISESGHHLLALINDILDLAKIEAGQITLDINKVDVNLVCQASLRMIKQLAQKKNLDVAVEIDEKIGLMWADERRLKQMMVNLLSNAVKFTPEGGKLGLQIQGYQEDNKVTITVWDTGIGIKEVDFQRLFQPFVQLDSGLAREATGTGLGLALVAQMARLHGGSVNVTSEPGQGSRFTIVLPWQPAQAMTIAEKLKVTGKFRAIKDRQGPQTILLVEDTQEVVMMIKDYLEIAGYKVITAQDGLDGITQAKLSHPDLILMDVQMPRMDGLEATKKLRQDANFINTPVIALTALAMPNDRERCLAAGMDEYISKPVNLRVLVRTIQSCLSIREEKTTPP